jgi:uncharacterized membrane protein (UPF0127 family)
MLKQNSSTTTRLSFASLLILFSLISAGCSQSKPNTLERPAADANQNSPTALDENLPTLDQTDNGQVAGAIQLPTKKMKINNLELEVEVADTDDARTEGLSGREKLDDGKGMLFDFSNTDVKTPGFWMKDMLISIDMIWINNGKVIGVQANAPLPPQDKDLPVYYPPAEITHVLEVPAGWSARNNVTIGSTVTL